MPKIASFHPEDAPTKFGHVLASYAMSKIFLDSHPTVEVHTHQMGLLPEAWERGFTIRIWYQGLESYTYDEFKVGDFTPSGKVLRKEHNMFRLWVSGALGEHLSQGYSS